MGYITSTIPRDPTRGTKKSKPIYTHTYIYIPYGGKVWLGDSLANLANHQRFSKLKPSKVVDAINNPLADLFIRQTFFHHMLEKRKFAKHSPRQTFPLYGI